MLKIVRAGALLAISSGSAAAVLPPEADPAIFDFTVGHALANINSVSNGNVRVYSAISPDLGVFNVRATAWSLKTSDNKIYASKLMVYSGGLGVISSLSNDDGTGSGGKHQIDNNVNKDFILLQFDRQTKMTAAVMNTYDLSGRKDSDALIRFGTTPAFDWQNNLGLAGKTKSWLETMMPGKMTSYTDLESSRIAYVNPTRLTGDVWMIGAAWQNPDSRVDAFKISHLAVIPEPQSWALMIAGFGLAGTAIRRRGKAIAAVA